MGVRAQTRSGYDLAPEMVELALGQPPFEKCASVHPRGGVALVVDLVTGFVVLAPEEVVEADFVEAGRRGIRRQVPADAGVLVVCPEDHRDRVPPHDPPNAVLEPLVTREKRLLLRADRVDVAGLGERRQPDVELAGSLEELEHEEPGAVLALVLDDLVE